MIQISNGSHPANTEGAMMAGLLAENRSNPMDPINFYNAWSKGDMFESNVEENQAATQTNSQFFPSDLDGTDATAKSAPSDMFGLGNSNNSSGFCELCSI